jgi:hypothetical protein
LPKGIDELWLLMVGHSAGFKVFRLCAKELKGEKAFWKNRWCPWVGLTSKLSNLPKHIDQPITLSRQSISFFRIIMIVQNVPLIGLENKGKKLNFFPHSFFSNLCSQAMKEIRYKM